MVILHFKTKEFFDYLGKCGCKLYSDEYAERDVVVYEKDGFIIPIELRRTYYPWYVCKICNDFKIPAPEDFIKVKKQLDQLLKISKSK